MSGVEEEIGHSKSGLCIERKQACGGYIQGHSLGSFWDSVAVRVPQRL